MSVQATVTASFRSTSLSRSTETCMSRGFSESECSFWDPGVVSMALFMMAVLVRAVSEFAYYHADAVSQYGAGLTAYQKLGTETR